ncbi:MAG: DMT family transporter [Acidimicrobiales bacterium]
MTGLPDHGLRAQPMPAVPRGRRALPGVAVAAITAVVSGLSIFVNSYGVHDFTSPAVYTTAKNLVSTLLLAGVMAAAVWAGRRSASPTSLSRYMSAPGARRPDSVAAWLGLAYVGIVSGGLAFILFFDGLADTTAAPAAFWRDTLVVWVALLAIPVLHERIRWWNAAAVILLIGGEVALSGGIGQLAADRGELLVLGATLLWAVEVVVAKLLLRDLAPGTLALVRMGVGSVTLVVYLAATGALHSLLGLDARQLGWALLTGALLAVYVGTWITALARARALDVTSVLVGSALVTWVLELAAGTATPTPDAYGLLLIAAGVILVGVMAMMGAGRQPPAPVTVPVHDGRH